MGRVCSGASKEFDPKLVPKRNRSKKKEEFNINLSSQIQEFMEDQGQDLSLNKPELGIYNTRSWDALYKKWLNNDGQNPGPHPDPDC